MIEDVLCLFSFFEMMYFLTILSRRHVRDAVFHFQLKLKIGWGAKNYFWLKVKINLLCCFASFSRKKIRFYFSLHPSHKDEVNVVTFFCLFLLFSLHRSFVILLVIELRYFNMRLACWMLYCFFCIFTSNFFALKANKTKWFWQSLCVLSLSIFL